MSSTVSSANAEIVSFGGRYDFGGGGLQKADDIPRFLEPVRRRAAAFATLQAGDLQHVLVTEYQPGAAIGWHKDRSVFRRCHWHFAGVVLHLPLTPESRCRVAARVRHAGAEIGLPSSR